MKQATGTSDVAARTMTDVIDASERVEVEWEAGSLLIIDNHGCLHGRAANEVDDPDRVLERIIVREA